MPRWQTWRKMHKKGLAAVRSKKRTRKTARLNTRSIGSFSLAQLKEKRAQKPEFRKAQRDGAVRFAPCSPHGAWRAPACASLLCLRIPPLSAHPSTHALVVSVSRPARRCWASAK